MDLPLLHVDSSGTVQEWKPVVLSDAGFTEKTLENVLVDNLDILGLRKYGLVYRNAKTFTQLNFPTPDGRRIIPDILALTDAGHVIIVEVKRLGNPELQGRGVIAQVVDYAASLSTLSERDIARRFLPDDEDPNLAEVVQAYFPDQENPENLAMAYMRHFSEGDLHLVIACDRAPRGIVPWIRAVSNQSALGFEIRVVELQPLTCAARPGEVIFQSTTNAVTEIIARTALTVRNEIGTERVRVDVSIGSGSEIEESVKETSAAEEIESYPEMLSVAESKLELDLETLEDELKNFSQRAMRENWSDVYEHLAWPDTSREPYLKWTRGGRYLYGRLGVNLVTPWRPGLFIGVIVDGTDHHVAPSQLDLGPDFALVLCLQRKNVWGEMGGNDFMAQPEFTALIERLNSDSGQWDFHDHLAEVKRPNRWHPIHLRKPLVDILKGVSSVDERYNNWLSAARDVVQVLLRGGELRSLRERLQAEG